MVSSFPSLPQAFRSQDTQTPKRLSAPLAVPYAGEAQLDVLSRRKSTQDAAALVPLGGAEKGQRGL